MLLKVIGPVVEKGDDKNEKVAKRETKETY